MKTKDEVVALAKAHGAYLHDESARLVFDYERLPAFAAACTLTHEQAYAIQTKAYFEACRIPPEERISILPAACAEPAVQADETATFATGDDDLDSLLFTTAHMQLGPKHNNMDTAIDWLECLEKVKARLVPADEQQADLFDIDTAIDAAMLRLLRDDYPTRCEIRAAFYLGLYAADIQPAPATPLTVTKQEVELAVQDYCLGVADNNEAMRHALEAFIARKGNPK